ncbi:MAG: Rne/Rng family ribonuclease [candidate division WOR-3 bacterium]
MNGEKQIILNVRRDDVRVAVRENGELIEFYIERGDIIYSPGTIIKGKIIGLRKELNGIFVDIGDDTAGFLPMNDYYLSFPEKRGKEGNSEVIVQVKKEPYGTKGARLTTFIGIPGRYLVLMPSKKVFGVSRKIRNKVVRERLKEIARKLHEDKMGIIIRTASYNEDIEVLKRDYLELKGIWEKILEESKKVSAPFILWKDEELPIRIVRDLLDDSISEVIVDSEEAFEKIIKYLKKKSSPFLERVKLYKNPTPIFNYYKIEQELRSIFRRKVYLKSGGYIVIDETEALTVFDVNTGSYRGRETTEEMIFKTNCEAAIEIARQLNLRDIGGIIIIDFIDMQKEENQEALLELFRKQLKRSKARYRLAPKLSPNGLLEMTRERVRENIAKKFVEPCPYCIGKGYALSAPYLFSRFTSWLEKKGSSLSNAKLRIIANPKVAIYFENEGKNTLDYSCKKNNMHIEFVYNENSPLEFVEVITYNNGEVIREEI